MGSLSAHKFNYKIFLNLYYFNIIGCVLKTYCMNSHIIYETLSKY